MKKLLLLTSFLILSWNTFSQTATTQPLTVKSDTTKVCLPTPIARQVAKDLIRLDGCREEIKLLESKIDKMQDITKVKDIMLQMYEEKDKNNQFIINQFELQTQQYEKLTNDLTKEVKSKRRNAVFWKIATGLGIFSSTYLLLR
jgi:TolA-binding protein